MTFQFMAKSSDMICLLGAVPERYKWNGDDVDLRTYFAETARGSPNKRSWQVGAFRDRD